MSCMKKGELHVQPASVTSIFQIKKANEYKIRSRHNLRLPRSHFAIWATAIKPKSTINLTDIFYPI